MKINIQNLDQNLFEIDGKVSADFLETEIRGFYPNEIDVHAKLDRFGKNYKIDVKIQTTASFVCDRCMATYSDDFSAKLDQVYGTGYEEADHDGDIIELPANATDIDISPQLREAILLYHPVKMLCSEDCKGICSKCGVDLNHDTCKCSEGDIDPRWEELKKLIK